MVRRNHQTHDSEEETMTDITDDTEVTPTEDNVPSEAPTAEAKPKQKRDPLLEGVGTPVDLANLLNKPVNEGGRDAKVRPQQIYGYLRNDNAGFREAVNARTHTDSRNILDLAAGLAWWDAKEVRKAERTAKAAAKATADAAKATETPASNDES
jgi:hypothetical protein